MTSQLQITAAPQRTIKSGAGVPMPAIWIATKNDLKPILALMEKYYEYDRHDFDRKKA